jgi:hypothetical protein
VEYFGQQTNCRNCQNPTAPLARTLSARIQPKPLKITRDKYEFNQKNIGNKTAENKYVPKIIGTGNTELENLKIG